MTTRAGTGEARGRDEAHAASGGTRAGTMAKGATVISTVEFLRTQCPAEALPRILAAMEPGVRGRVQAATPTGEVPFEDLVALWRAADAELRDRVPDWTERAGAFSIGQRGAQLYGGILRKATPREFLTQSVSLFQLFYHPGNMLVVEERVGYAVLRLVAFPAIEPLFCRRQSGGLAQALAIAGGERPRVAHVRCACEGDAFCEWELRWEEPAGEPARDADRDAARGTPAAGIPRAEG